MSRRRKTSGGQALVLVTLALFAMTGIMGLAVDMGWSFFVQKRAQAAADSAALGAAQEAMTRLRNGASSVSGFTCAAKGTTATTVDCEPTTISCSAVVPASNLKNGCQYALANGFNWTAGSNQNVTMQSNDGLTADLPTLTISPNGSGATAPSPKNMSYWVTAGTVQQVPQLFSAILNNNQAVVSAVATAAIAGVLGPGSFFGMNQAGDCWGFSGVANTNCGMDLNGAANANGAPCSAAAGAPLAEVCAPAGIILASTCNTATANTCSQAWAGTANSSLSKGVGAGSLVLHGANSSTGGIVQNPADWYSSANGVALTPFYTNDTSTFEDFYVGTPQPPLQATQITSCGVPSGTTLSGTLGPFQYYSYTGATSPGIPDGNPINLGDVTFSASGTCSSGFGITGTSQAGSSFPTYIFWGGVNEPKSNTTINLGPGQYVMAGVNSSAANSYVLQIPGTLTQTAGGVSAGSMIILTDGSYPGLTGIFDSATGAETSSSTGQNSKIPGGMPPLYQGSVSIGNNATITLTGMVNSTVSGISSLASMDVYSGIAIWQDRRNSMIQYNDYPVLAPTGCTACTTDDGTYAGCAGGAAAGCGSYTPTQADLQTYNHVTSTSPGIVLANGNPTLNVTGGIYQPRGAWIDIQNGTGLGSGYVQIVTGSLSIGSGNAKLLLNGPTNPIITYRAVLIR